MVGKPHALTACSSLRSALSSSLGDEIDIFLFPLKKSLNLLDLFGRALFRSKSSRPKGNA